MTGLCQEKNPLDIFNVFRQTHFYNLQKSVYLYENCKDTRTLRKFIKNNTGVHLETNQWH